MKNVNSRAALRNLTIKALVAFAAFGATSANATVANMTAQGTIVAPITMTQPVALRFGNISPSATVTGTIVMDPPATMPTAGPTTALPILNSTRVGTGAVAVGGNCVAVTNICGVGSFLITGTANAVVTATVPATAILASGVNTMTLTPTYRYGIINTTGATSGTTALGTTGLANILVGGSLAVGIAQPAGAYTITMPIDISY